MTADDCRVELYVRSLFSGQAHSQQEDVLKRLERLQSDTVIDEFRVLVWGKQAPASPAKTRTDAGLFALNRVAVFSEWAERNGFSINNHFQRQTVKSEMLDTEYRVLKFPVMTLAEYEGEDLRFVAPVAGPEANISIHDRLDTLATTTDSSMITAVTDDDDSDTEDDTDKFEVLDQAYTEPPSELTLTPGDDITDS